MFVLRDRQVHEAYARHRIPTAVAQLPTAPHGVTVELRLFCAPAEDGAEALATVRVVFHADACAVETTYDQGRVPAGTPPLLLVSACLAGLYGLWGGPPHFVRLASRLLATEATRLSPN